MQSKALFLVIAVMGISGCSTVPTQWYNPNIKDSSQQMYQLSHDQSVCVNVSQGMAPMPVAPMYVPPPQSYNVNAQVVNYGYNNSTVYGHITPVPSFSSSFASGYNSGIALGEAIRRRQMTDTYVACMKQLGWTDKPDTQPSTTQASPTQSTNTQTSSNQSSNKQVAIAEPSNEGAACKTSSECTGSLVCSAGSDALMKCMSSDTAIKLMK